MSRTLTTTVPTRRSPRSVTAQPSAALLGCGSLLRRLLGRLLRGVLARVAVGGVGSGGWLGDWAGRGVLALDLGRDLGPGGGGGVADLLARGPRGLLRDRR